MTKEGWARVTPRLDLAQSVLILLPVHLPILFRDLDPGFYASLEAAII